MTVKLTEQCHLQRALSEIFPHNEIIQNSRRRSNVVSPDSGSYLEFDFWIPELQLAFEFQDQYHYATTFYSNSSLATIKMVDDTKRMLLQDRGGTVIHIPCWWNGSINILKSTIHAQRNDLFPEVHGTPILSSEPPPDFFKVGQVPSIGELTHYSFAIKRFDPVSWWMSEKYDGVRACWHYKFKQLYSWRGRIYDYLLPSFYTHLSRVKGYLDGEIWFGRGTFALSQDFARGVKERCIDWQFIRYIVFDIPYPSDVSSPIEDHLPHTPSASPVQNLSCSPESLPRIDELLMEERYASLLECIPSTHPFGIVSPNTRVATKAHLQEALQKLLQSMGEGLIVRAPRSPYFHGRSPQAIKFKRHAREEEGIVLVPFGNGLCLVFLPTGDTITAAPAPEFLKSIESIEHKRRISDGEPLDNHETRYKLTSHSVLPSAGDIVTFVWASGASRTRGIILRVRKDLSWFEVAHNKHSQQQHVWTLHPPVKRPMGYWTSNHNTNMRAFMCDVARSHFFDPLVAANWYGHTKDFLLSEPGGVTILNHYKGSFKRAVMDLFPDIGLKEHLFEHASKGYWNDENSTRTFFYTYAEKHGFNPHDMENWYGVTAQAIRKQKGGYSILRKFKGATTQALLSVFPELEEARFGKVRGGYWQYTSNVKVIFDRFALKAGFDPLDPECWYKMGHLALEKEKKKYSILRTYGSIYHALVAAYPSIGLRRCAKSKYLFIS